MNLNKTIKALWLISAEEHLEQAMIEHTFSLSHVSNTNFSEKQDDKKS